MNKDFN